MALCNCLSLLASVNTRNSLPEVVSRSEKKKERNTRVKIPFGFLNITSLHTGLYLGWFLRLDTGLVVFYEGQQTKHPVFFEQSVQVPRGIITEIAKVLPISVRSFQISITVMCFFKVLFRSD